MAGFFNLPSSRATTKKDQQLLKKSKNPISPTAVKLTGSGKLADRIQAIISVVKSKFAGKEDSLLLITDKESLSRYIDKCVENGKIAIDTETTGLDPILDDIVGMSIYTPGQKAAYIPLKHISYITQKLCSGQLEISYVKSQLQRLVDNNVKTIWFNAPFDIRFIGNKIGVWFTAYFDTSIASRCLNSNEPDGQKTLKALHLKYCWNNRGEALTFGKLFEGIPFNLVPISVAYLYAASDAVYTYELYEFQAQYLEEDGIYYKDFKDLSWMFFNVEMASMPTFISMEQTGVAIDYEWAEEISSRYHEYNKKVQYNLERVCKEYQNLFDDYRRSHPNCKLTDPINFESPTQLAIVLYDILEVKPPDPKNPRGTGAEILAKIDHPLCRAVLDTRAFTKVLSTYIDKIPEQAKLYPDKRIHCKFNQYGADTGRVSSNSPNLQNIPSNPFLLGDGTVIKSGHDVRQLFTASPGCVLMSCDYSGQEVRVTAHLANDKKMIQAYKDDRDVYSEIAAIAFNTTYEECCEFRPDGTTNAEGKARRGSAKKIVLGKHIIAPVYSDICRKVCEPYCSWVY